MAEPFMSEIRMMSCSFAPQGWALANGQLLPINQNQALFSLLGTNFGGDGRVSLGLPDLRGRVPIHVGNIHTLGQKGGEMAHTITISELPTHRHTLNTYASENRSANSITPNNAVLASSHPNTLYNDAETGSLVALDSNSINNVGGSQPHLNMQPFLTISFCIALQGIFPSPT